MVMRIPAGSKVPLLEPCQIVADPVEIGIHPRIDTVPDRHLHTVILRQLAVGQHRIADIIVLDLGNREIQVVLEGLRRLAGTGQEGTEDDGEER